MTDVRMVAISEATVERLRSVAAGEFPEDAWRVARDVTAAWDAAPSDPPAPQATKADA